MIKVEIANMVMKNMKSLDPEDERDLMMATMMPFVCVVIEELINEGKIKLC